MAKYGIRVIEQSSRIIEIDARSYKEAVEKVSKMYYNEEIVLDAENLYCVSFS